jgi:hypothetical protein
MKRFYFGSGWDILVYLMGGRRISGLRVVNDRDCGRTGVPERLALIMAMTVKVSIREDFIKEDFIKKCIPRTGASCSGAARGSCDVAEGRYRARNKLAAKLPDLMKNSLPGNSQLSASTLIVAVHHRPLPQSGRGRQSNRRWLA